LISLAADCPDGTWVQHLGEKKLIDPSGFVTDACTGDPIQGVRVTLQRLVGGTWVNADPNEQAPGGGPIMDPQTNPLFTDEVGHYAWDVIAGTWRVSVDMAGYVAQVSREVVIPPPVTDLDLQLQPVAGCPEEGAGLTVCPGPGQWAIAAFTGNDDTATQAVLDTCSGIALGWALEDVSQVWTGYDVSAPPVLNTLLSVDHLLGLVVLGGDTAVAANPALTVDQVNDITICPEPGDWAVTVWMGADNTAIEQAFAACPSIELAWSLEPSSADWAGWLAGGLPGLNELTELDHLQAILVLGG
jgi:hypothetical protein